jgi:predicted transcriptional regulator
MSQVAQRAHIGAYVDAEQRRQLVELAQRDDRSVSSVIRAALASYVRDQALRDVREKADRFKPIGGTS